MWNLILIHKVMFMNHSNAIEHVPTKWEFGLALVQSNIWPNVLPSAWTSSHSRLTALRRLKTNILRRLLLIRIPKHSSVCRCIPTTYNRYKWKKNPIIYLFLMKKFYFSRMCIHPSNQQFLSKNERKKSETYSFCVDIRFIKMLRTKTIQTPTIWAALILVFDFRWDFTLQHLDHA